MLQLRSGQSSQQTESNYDISQQKITDNQINNTGLVI